MISPEEIVIEIEDGVVKSVRCTDPDAVIVTVIDRDNELYNDVKSVVIPDKFKYCDVFGAPEDEWGGDEWWEFFKNLEVGDEVFWNDPDEGKCSRKGEIFRIETDDGKVEDDDTVIWLKFPDGGEAQVYVKEVMQP